MSNIVDLPPNKKSGLYKAPSHDDGGVRVIVDGTKAVEVEGSEYHICKSAMLSTEIYEFKNKTNKEILDKLFIGESCLFSQGSAFSGEFIVCKLVVLDNKKRNLTGTVKEILNIMQSEKSCNVTQDATDTYAQRLGGTQSNDDTSEIEDMIHLLEITVKENPKDVESNDMLELLRITLSDKGVSKKDKDESTLVKIFHKLENDDKFGEGYLKSVWSNHTPPTITKNMILDRYKKIIKELSNDEMQELIDKKHLLTEDEYKKYHGEKEFIVKYVNKDRLHLKGKMQGQSKTWIVAKDRDDVLKKLKKEFPDFGKLISIKPVEKKYNEGGDLDTNVVSSKMVAVHNSDLSGLIFANKRGGFFYPSVELIDVDNYSGIKLPLSVLLLFSGKQYKTPDYIEIDEVIGAVIPSNMGEAKDILNKHHIPFSAYELNVPNINDSKINAVKELSKTHNNIFIDND